MIIVVAGPSGSGKTTFISKCIELHLAKAVPVEVFSKKNNRNYEFDIGRKAVSEEEFLKKQKSGEYEIINQYDSSFYGYSLKGCDNSAVYIIDYPGEYPECADLSNYIWKGLLILPPSKEELISRLKASNRDSRIESACKEYDECLSDIALRKLDQWRVFINDDVAKMESFIHLFFNNLH